MKTYLSVIFILFTFFIYSQTHSKHIVVDQFGYRSTSEKIAVLRNPVTGFDASESFTPGTNYALVNAANGVQVFTGNSVPWNSGAEDDSSGDKVWWFNFSSYQVPGTYYVLDISQNLKSYEFIISDNVYEAVLKQAVRTFFYQRVGYAKEAQYAGANWADGASHLGTLQDTQARKYNAATDTSTEKDLSGGWYDAGDYNKYTRWTANYIVDLLKAYSEAPNAFGDDYNLPYSGNTIPDVIDEVKWGLDHLLRLQEADGSMISIVDLSHASPPSSATGQSLYGDVNTSSTLASAVAFAYGAKVFQELGMTVYSNTLLQSAINAWDWADANPNVIWENNSAAYNSVGIGAGQQETDDYGRFACKMKAAIHLFDVTDSVGYKAFIDANYQDMHLMLWSFAYPFEQENQETLLYYATLPNATISVANSIVNTYKSAMNGTDNFGGLTNESDPYLAHLTAYVWGSNGTKSRKGLMFTDYIKHNIEFSNNDDALRAAERYIHYIHGVNPLNFCYLSNMYDFGADNGVNEFYHTWFGDGTEWDNVQNDLYGPAPGYLVGGANPSYNWDGCCPSGCSGRACDAIQVSRINGQPKQKAYDDFNTSWPMNSWEVTENSNGYQVAYIRLLSKFVTASGSLSIDDLSNETNSVNLYPNPFSYDLKLKSKESFDYEVYDLAGRLVREGFCNLECLISGTQIEKGFYLVKVKGINTNKTFKIVKR
ncbi:glycoside hydrolase family 9 protein [Thalassobellus citreus]|uniref:glycoside hydrolase family 9 protein n=1 Tax=Thalassobellus citreus TaxID=3367752 RepID=UPI00378F22F5